MTRHTPSRTRETIEQLLSAIESRDLRAVERYLHPDVVWQNVPHPPTLGRQAVTELLANVLCWSDQVRWDILSSAVSGETGWYERVDCFWIAGEEHAVHCNGVFEVDAGTQMVRSVRDYVDLGEWRSRIEPVLTQLASRPASRWWHVISMRSGVLIPLPWPPTMVCMPCYRGPVVPMQDGRQSQTISIPYRRASGVPKCCSNPLSPWVKIRQGSPGVSPRLAAQVTQASTLFQY